MSARAALRLETLGFARVYRYTPGKADWSANGLPMEGPAAAVLNAGNAIRRNPPTCELDDHVGTVRARVREAGWDMCIVVDGEDAVLGRLGQEALAAPPESTAETVMESGPTTIRPDVTLDSILSRLRQKDVQNVLVTTSDGQLLGVLYRDDAERQAAGGAAPNEEDACECGV